MKNEWFKECGWVYVPVSWQGALFSLLAFLFCLYVFYVVDQDTPTITDTIFGSFPYWVSAAGILFWIASKTVKK